MPVHRRSSLSRLRERLDSLPLARGRRILLSCVLIPGLTGTDAHLDALARFAAGLPVLVNLIPFNPIPSSPWRAPSPVEVLQARDRLDRAGIPVRVRLPRGGAAMAACGQLGDPERLRSGGDSM